MRTTFTRMGSLAWVKAAIKLAVTSLRAISVFRRWLHQLS